MDKLRSKMKRFWEKTFSSAKHVDLDAFQREFHTYCMKYSSNEESASQCVLHWLCVFRKDAEEQQRNFITRTTFDKIVSRLFPRRKRSKDVAAQQLANPVSGSGTSANPSPYTVLAPSKRGHSKTASRAGSAKPRHKRSDGVLLNMGSHGYGSTFEQEGRTPF